MGLADEGRGCAWSDRHEPQPIPIDRKVGHLGINQRCRHGQTIHQRCQQGRLFSNHHRMCRHSDVKKLRTICTCLMEGQMDTSDRPSHCFGGGDRSPRISESCGDCIKTLGSLGRGWPVSQRAHRFNEPRKPRFPSIPRVSQPFTLQSIKASHRKHPPNVI